MSYFRNVQDDGVWAAGGTYTFDVWYQITAVVVEEGYDLYYTNNWWDILYSLGEGKVAWGDYFDIEDYVENYGWPTEGWEWPFGDWRDSQVLGVAISDGSGDGDMEEGYWLTYTVTVPEDFEYSSFNLVHWHWKKLQHASSAGGLHTISDQYYLENQEFYPITVIGSIPALPEKAVLISPTPSGVENVTGNAGLEWEDGGLGEANAATGFDLYFADSEAGLAKIGESREADETTETALVVNGDSFYDGGKTYYWRVDAFNDNGTTTGDVWSFTVYSEALIPERPDDYDANLSSGGGGRYKQHLIVVGHKKIYVDISLTGEEGGGGGEPV